MGDLASTSYVPQVVRPQTLIIGPLGIFHGMISGHTFRNCEIEGNEILLQSLVCACGGIGPTFSSCSFLETGLDKGLKGLMNHELVSCCKNIQKQSKCGESSWIKHGGEVDDFTRHFTRIFCPLGFSYKATHPATRGLLLPPKCGRVTCGPHRCTPHVNVLLEK
jgi:hypothetical protein